MFIGGVIKKKLQLIMGQVLERAEMVTNWGDGLDGLQELSHQSPKQFGPGRLQLKFETDECTIEARKSFLSAMYGASALIYHGALRELMCAAHAR